MEEQNNRLKFKVEQLVTYIKNQETYIRYCTCYKKMKQDKEIMAIINEIKQYEQRLVKEKSLDKNIDDIEKEIVIKKDKLREYPIYQEYSYLQEDLNNLFQQIRSIIQKEIDKYLLY